MSKYVIFVEATTPPLPPHHTWRMLSALYSGIPEVYRDEKIEIRPQILKFPLFVRLKNSLGIEFDQNALQVRCGQFRAFCLALNCLIVILFLQTEVHTRRVFLHTKRLLTVYAISFNVHVALESLILPNTHSKLNRV